MVIASDKALTYLISGCTVCALCTAGIPESSCACSEPRPIPVVVGPAIPQSRYRLSIVVRCRGELAEWRGTARLARELSVRVQSVLPGAVVTFASSPVTDDEIDEHCSRQTAQRLK